MSIRKTTIALPADRIERLRVKAIREKTTMSELIARAVEACYFAGDTNEPLEAFLRPDPAVASTWLKAEGDEPEDFDEADID